MLFGTSSEREGTETRDGWVLDVDCPGLGAEDVGLAVGAGLEPEDGQG